MKMSKREKEMRALVEQELERMTTANLKAACLQLDRDNALCQTVEVLAAMAWHAQTAASYTWAQLSPVRVLECESLLYNEHNAIRLLAHFTNSLRWNKWDITRHPPFPAFCRGIMAAPHCPIEMQRDRELGQMFPPEPLAGIIGYPPQWRPD